MSRIWLIGWHHFRQEVSKRSFLLVLLSLPLFLTLTIGLGALSVRLSDEEMVVGYVDPAHFLQDTTLAVTDEPVELLRFDDAAAAQTALTAGTILAYYALSPDFPANPQVELVYLTPPPWQAQNAFATLVQQNRLADQPADIRQRVLAGPTVAVHATASGRVFPTAGPTVAMFLPLLAAASLGFLIMTSSGYMMEVIITEKENRTMEILVASLSAGKILFGKTMGALGLAALQALIWFLCFVGAAGLGSLLEIGWLQNLHPDWGDIGLILLIGGPVYIFMAAVMTAIGSTLVDSQDAQQAGPFYLLILYIPFFFLGAIAESPHGPVALALSFFPPTALTAFALRLLFDAIPTWQVIVFLLVSLAGGGGMIWLAGKAFRLSLLRYGQRLRWRELFRAGRGTERQRSSS